MLSVQSYTRNIVKIFIRLNFCQGKIGFKKIFIYAQLEQRDLEKKFLYSLIGNQKLYSYVAKHDRKM